METKRLKLEYLKKLSREYDRKAFQRRIDILTSVLKRIANGKGKWLGFLMGHPGDVYSDELCDDIMGIFRDKTFSTYIHNIPGPCICEMGDLFTSFKVTCPCVEERTIVAKFKKDTGLIGYFGPETPISPFGKYFNSEDADTETLVEGVKKYGVLPDNVSLFIEDATRIYEAIPGLEFGPHRRVCESILKMIDEGMTNQDEMDAKTQRVRTMCLFMCGKTNRPDATACLTDDRRMMDIIESNRKKTIYSLWEEFEDCQDNIDALLFAYEKDSSSLFYKENIPFDILKLIFKTTFSYIAGF